MKILSNPMKLSEIMKKILKPHGPKDEGAGFAGTLTQTELEKIIKVPQWKLSNWKNAADSSEDEQNWQWALKLFTYCERELGFDPRIPFESPKREGKGMELARKTKGKPINKGNEKL